MKKRIFSLLLLACMVLSMLPMGVFATDVPLISWDAEATGDFEAVGTALTSYTVYDGAMQAETVSVNKNATLGTKENPIAISSEADLIRFGRQVTSDTTGKYYILDKPGGAYDMEGDNKYMLPLFKEVIATSSGMPTLKTPFSGILLGNGATITNATIGDYSTTSGAYSPGLFSGVDNGAIYDLTVTNCTFYLAPAISLSNAPAGGIVAGAKGTTINNCHTSDNDFRGLLHVSFAEMGGILGGGDSSTTLQNCSNAADISASGSNAQVGGIAGFTNKAVNNCYNTGNISGSGKYATVGGIAGFTNGAVNNCYNTGAISASGDYANVGGIVGHIQGGAGYNCYNTGAISASGSNANVGGIAGYVFLVNVSNCYWSDADMNVMNVGYGDNATACGTIGADKFALTEGTEANSGAEQTLADYATDLLAALNGWVDAQTTGTYRTWTADNATTNGGYPVFFTPVTGITGVATTAVAGTNLALNGTVAPADATNKTIEWSVKSAGTTGASITGSTLSTMAAGTVVVTATIENGLTESTDYTQDFTLTVTSPTPPPSDGGSYTPPSVTIPVTGSDTTMKIDVTISGTTVTMKEPTKENLDKIIAAAAKDKKPLVIDLSTLDNKLSNVKLPANTITAAGKSASEGGVSGLTITLPNSNTVSFDQTATTAIADAAKGKTLTLSIDQRVGTKQTSDEKNLLTGQTVTHIFDLDLRDESGNIVSSFDDGTATVVLTGIEITGNPADFRLFHSTGGKLAPQPFTLAENPKGGYDLTTVTTSWSSYILTYQENKNPFADVAEGVFYYDAVIWAAEKGITTGTSETTFSPDGSCDRAQVVTLLWNAMGKPAPTSTANLFTDVKTGSYYYDAVLWAAEKGITGGTAATTFSPDTVVTRSQFVTFLHRAAGKPVATASNPFTDVTGEAAYYYSAIL